MADEKENSPEAFKSLSAKYEDGELYCTFTDPSCSC